MSPMARWDFFLTGCKTIGYGRADPSRVDVKMRGARSSPETVKHETGVTIAAQRPFGTIGSATKDQTASWVRHRLRGRFAPLLPIVAPLFPLLLGLWLWMPVSAQESHCDPNLHPRGTSPLRYRLHGDRCEGIYIKEVGSTTLLVASLTESFEDYDLSSGKDLIIEWTAPGDGGIHLRAQGVRPRLYYRMDTLRPPQSKSYAWPSNILAALKIGRKDIGLVGWTRYPVGKIKRNVYVPLRVTQRRNPSGSGRYQVVVVPGRELTEVFISVAAVGPNKRPGRFLRDGDALGYGYYPAGRGIRIPISNLKAPGVYYLGIGATLKGGGATAVDVWFYHRGG